MNSKSALFRIGYKDSRLFFDNFDTNKKYQISEFGIKVVYQLTYVIKISIIWANWKVLATPGGMC